VPHPPLPAARAQASTVVASPVGPLALVAEGGSIRGLRFASKGAVPEDPAGLDGPRGSDGALLRSAADQLAAYFDGTLTAFDLPLALSGSPFELRVWQALTEIPYGEMCSYGRIAAEVGDPGAARAVGTANNRNPVAIVVPCHRVVGAGKTLVGYGGGLPRKRFLLELEARVVIERDFAPQ
jgi:methylated-DNA-[protein]-cysteine S-methyltransferase